jgi:hypothetical protein
MTFSGRKMTIQMAREFTRQYRHAFRVFEALVNEFDENSWNTIGRKRYTPARISYHILHSIKYYLEDASDLPLPSKRDFEMDWEKTPARDLLPQDEIIYCIQEIQQRTEYWLLHLEYEQQNTSFEWAGETKLGIALFSLRHFLYHLGEVSSLLNESKGGDVDDIYVKV